MPSCLGSQDAIWGDLAWLLLLLLLLLLLFRERPSWTDAVCRRDWFR